MVIMMMIMMMILPQNYIVYEKGLDEKFGIFTFNRNTY